MASKVNIVNMAISHLAISKTVMNLETDDGQEAKVARLFYDTARKATLRDFPWPFATRIITAGLIEEEPNTEWGFSYRYPTDCVYLRRILSGLRNDSRQTRSPYRIASDTSGKLIFTDQEDAEIEYTVNTDDPQFYPEDFTLAFSYYLAHLMAPRLTGGDQFKLGEKALELYRFEISRAVSRGANEEQIEEPPEAEWTRARGTAGEDWD